MLLFFNRGLWAGSIVGSPHDFKGYLWQRSGEICAPCHAPHNIKTQLLPLWDPEAPHNAYVMYRTVRSDESKGKDTHQPDGISKICLSCHDGVLSHDSYGTNPDIESDDEKNLILSLGRSNNHPVSFTYDKALALKKNDLHDPSTRRSGITGSKGTIQSDMLFLTRLECSSCHDVHNTKAVPGTKLLVKDNAVSALCLTCHDK